MRPPVLDDRDRATVAERMRAYDARTAPQEGDWVDFADGVQRRISHVWPDGVQTSDGGSFHLGLYGMSYSGALYTSVPTSSLEPTDGRRGGWAWIFHHDVRMAHNGVDCQVDCRVWRCTVAAPTW